MKTQLTVVALAILALPAAANPPLFGPAPPPAPQEGRIEVQGVAEVSIDPDAAVLRLSIDEWDADREKAMSRVETTWKKVTRALPSELRVITQLVALNEAPKYFGNVQRHGYQASRSFEIKTRNLKQLDRLIARLVDAGVTRIVELRFEASDLAAHKAKARVEAVKAAHDKAKAMAAAVGQRVGRAVSLVEAGQGHFNRVSSSYSNISVEAISAGGIPSAGAVKATLTVKAIFELS